VTQAAGLDRRARGNVARLAAGQAMAGANTSVFYATGSVVGSMLAPDPALATLPLSVLVVGMALATLPTGWVSRRYGRRAAFIAGTGCGCIAGLLATVALLLGSFPLYCCAAGLGGVYAAVIQSFRFAAADGVGHASRAKAIAWVMAGGIFAGVLGPQLVTWTMDVWPTRLFAASYMAQAVVALVAMLVLSGVDLPRPAAGALPQGRPLGTLIRQPIFIAAALCGVVSYTLMNLMMTSAPLAMRMCGMPVQDSNFAIQWHIVAMYAPSFFTGSIIGRFGAPRVVAVGLLILAGAALVGLSGETLPLFVTAMVLLGLGWNFGFVGASAMVMETHRPEERNKVQAFNDFLVFGTMAVGSFTSGGLLAHYGWDSVNWVMFPPVAAGLLALAVGWFGRARARARAV
jgi:MFS family permease